MTTRRADFRAIPVNNPGEDWIDNERRYRAETERAFGRVDTALRFVEGGSGFNAPSPSSDITQASATGASFRSALSGPTNAVALSDPGFTQGGADPGNYIRKQGLEIQIRDGTYLVQVSFNMQSDGSDKNWIIKMDGVNQGSYVGVPNGFPVQYIGLVCYAVINAPGPTWRQVKLQTLVGNNSQVLNVQSTFLRTGPST